MKSIRTNLDARDEKMFRSFCDENELSEVMIGAYLDNALYPFTYKARICYAYSEKHSHLGEILTFMIMKFGSIEKAFYEFKQKHEKKRYFKWQY